MHSVRRSAALRYALSLERSSKLSSQSQEREVRVLLVEDEVDDAELLQLELERRGLRPLVTRVETESGLRGALEWGEWDVVISDYSMPMFDGLRAFRIAREVRPDLPFIFVSGALGEERAVEAMRAGARDYIVKGSHYSRVCEAIRRELDVVETRRRGVAAEGRVTHELEVQKIAVEATGAGIVEITQGAAGALNVNWLWEGCIRGHLADDGATIASLGVLDAWLNVVVHPDDRARIDTVAAELQAGGEHTKIGLRVRDDKGKWLDTQTFLRVSERDSFGAIKRVVAVILDVTEHRALEAQFRQAQKMEAIGRLAGGVAHDFNNLLTVIIGFAQLLSVDLPIDSGAREDLDEISKAAKRASTLTNQLLAFARQSPAMPRVISPGVVVRDADGLLKQLLTRGIEFERKIAPDVWNVRIDPIGLEQVVMNLVVNARDAMPKGGRVTLSVENRTITEPLPHGEATIPPGEYVLVSVEDTGEGMDAATQTRIFEPFFTTKPAGKGTGLGLSVCFGIVKQAEGFIVLESVVDKGTTFRILLPRTQDAGEVEVERRTVRELRGSERIIVVESDDQVRALALRALGELGYLARGASNAAQAWTLLAEGAIAVDLVVCDAGARNAGNIELQERLRSMSAPPKVLYLSVSGDAADGAPTPAKAAPVLAKPFTPHALLEAVRDVLDAPLDPPS
jgi:signal transduction histidine kinase/DNA-binding response OmpR family regulator